VFYDREEEVFLWGKDLSDTLDAVYRQRARFVVMFISEHYAKKIWTNHERKSALAKVLESREEYVLPARFDYTELPGIRPTIGYIDLTKETPETFASKIVKKIGNAHVQPDRPALLEERHKRNVGELRRWQGHNGGVNSAAFSPDGGFAVTGGADNAVCIWDLTMGKRKTKIEAHDGEITSVAYSFDGRMVFSGSADKSVRLWDISNTKRIEFAETCDTPIVTVAFSPDNRFVLYGVEGGFFLRKLSRWEDSVFVDLHTFSGYSGLLRSAVFSPDSKYVLVGTGLMPLLGFLTPSGNKMYLWEIEKRKEVFRFDHTARGYVNSVAFSLDGRRVAAGCTDCDKTIWLWNIQSREPLYRFHGHTGDINSVVFLPDNTVIPGSRFSP